MFIPIESQIETFEKKIWLSLSIMYPDSVRYARLPSYRSMERVAL